MLELFFTSPLLFLVWILAFLIAITIHEFAHAFAANHLGDPTPRLQGRLTLNPLKHLDPLGTALLIFFRFGWGKPVVFDPYNLQNPRRDSALISFAGPFANLVLASFLSLVLRFFLTPFSPLFFIALPIKFIITLNVWLAIFNLIPIHPLDGGKILVGILPPNYARQVDLFLTRYGIFILIFLILTPFLSTVIFPIADFIITKLIPGSSFI